MKHRPPPWVLAAVALLWSSSAAAAPDWSGAETRRRVAAEGVVTLHVVVALCSNAQIHCGSAGLGRPGDLRTNLYWGAIFGAKRFLERRRGGWEALPHQPAPAGVMERVAFRRFVPGGGWGRSEPVEVVLVVDAVHGGRIDDAVIRFFRRATEGGDVTVRGREGLRVLPVVVAGYAGHNRLMDGLSLPVPRGRGAAIPAFVLACRSRVYFAKALTDAGVRPLVTTETLMAPEGYLLDAIATAVGRGDSARGVRWAAIGAYARWQRIGGGVARRVFVPAKR